MDTMRATIVKMPPVAEVSSWSVWIFRKKSKDFNIVDIIINVVDIEVKLEKKYYLKSILVIISSLCQIIVFPEI